ncbi:helix-turn-helix domain-containing protein [Bradyrhizobium sp. AUGA SZCCT0431]|uniref:helix-turn-helix domain-containing protein n=1 Tax=Bradyrhizobium sp. AUGA SZCCT0431 TaxID=2807674 RepID=UPI001BA66AD4|nr:helix-turn-helix transcriptional regulator [Bradyrhizobium sp. AUGA SZCCT0431]MBR1146654.1 helix-turn-helix transcriptional regulator [Bradyrhizobium sp. AUGA SZCCT0431]
MKIERLPNRDSVAAKPDIGARVRQARNECGLSQTELANELGFESPTAISLIESNSRNISAQKLYQIAHITNLPIAFFFGV